MGAECEEPGEEAGEVLEVVRGAAVDRVRDVEQLAVRGDVEEVVQDRLDVAEVCGATTVRWPG